MLFHLANMPAEKFARSHSTILRIVNRIRVGPLTAAYNALAAARIAAHNGVVPAQFPSFRTQAAGATPFFRASPNTLIILHFGFGISD
jgi:hypothetical protein